MEAEFYNKLHRRFPIAEIPALISDLGALELHSERFIENFEIICTRNPYYAKKLLKWMIDAPIDKYVTISQDNLDDEHLLEWIYPRYVDLLPVGPPSPTTKDIIRYQFGPPPMPSVDILETPNLLSALGTTGFRTWEAALYLSYYLCSEAGNPVYRNATILELGAGTGMVSLTWLKLHPESSVYVTDGDATLLETQLRENFVINGFEPAKTPRISLRRLLWNVDQPPQNDIVLAADVAYDSKLLPDLCSCLATSLTESGTQYALVAASVRNEATVIAFQEQCNQLGIAYTIIKSTENEDSYTRGFFAQCMTGPLLAPIRIYRLNLRS
ncbi:HGL242Cp [Eremothecium sinecaudum]|uniref:HGL242Cp n=1 Tax=Eremothecium sinecaudum TaxID=45286 RepID=A0A109V0L9_9SACH|nr:HGL242Cp [Eremothecium sinecaudum]AMD22098.1 HGL242Cp [Eremothecium sinecaudum]